MANTTLDYAVYSPPLNSKKTTSKNVEIKEPENGHNKKSAKSTKVEKSTPPRSTPKDVEQNDTEV